MCVYIYISYYIHVCVYIHTYIYIYIYMYMYMYMCIHTFMYIYTCLGTSLSCFRSRIPEMELRRMGMTTSCGKGQTATTTAPSQDMADTLCLE